MDEETLATEVELNSDGDWINIIETNKSLSSIAGDLRTKEIKQSDLEDIKNDEDWNKFLNQFDWKNDDKIRLRTAVETLQSKSEMDDRPLMSQKTLTDPNSVDVTLHQDIYCAVLLIFTTERKHVSKLNKTLLVLMSLLAFFLQFYLSYYVIWSIQKPKYHALKNQNVDQVVAVSRVVGVVVLFIYCGQQFGDNLIMYLQWHIFYKTYYHTYKNKRCKLFCYLIFHIVITAANIAIMVLVSVASIDLMQVSSDVVSIVEYSVILFFILEIDDWCFRIFDKKIDALYSDIFTHKIRMANLEHNDKFFYLWVNNNLMPLYQIIGIALMSVAAFDVVTDDHQSFSSTAWILSITTVFCGLPWVTFLVGFICCKRR